MRIGITIYNLGLGMTIICWLAFSTESGVLHAMNHGSYKMAILLFASTALLAVLAIQVVYTISMKKSRRI